MKRIFILLAMLYALPVPAAELLGRISDDTEQVIESQPPVSKNASKITYRVICSPGSEVEPECAQQPVDDVVETVPHTNLNDPQASR